MIAASESTDNTQAEALLPAKKILRQTPANLIAADSELFAAGSGYSTFDAHLRHLGTVQVSPDSVVYRHGKLITETVVEGEQISYYRYKHLAKKLLTAKRVVLEGGKRYLLVTDAWSAGHFHWFMEVLPKLILIEGKAGDFVLMLPDTPYVRTVGVESLKFLGIKFADILWMKEDQFFKVSDLYYLTRLASPGQVNDDVMQELNKRFRGDRKPGTKRFYISRSSARMRKVLNEDELETVLKVHGFETILPENHTLSDQIDLFAKCNTVIGIHGAGLTNCLFMPRGGNVVELRKREPNYGYWHLADSVGHKYYYYHGIPDSEASLIGHGCNLTIPIKDFEDKILKIIA